MATKVATKGAGAAPTVEQIQSDIITQLANQYWAPYSTVPRAAYNPKVIEDVYRKEILGTKFSIRRVMLLEFSQYLENYLWPNYSPDKATKAHIISIIAMVNEKFRERVPAWESFKSKPDNFAAFFRHVLQTGLQDDDDISYKERTALIAFLIHCFNSLGEDLIREQVQRLVSLPIWINILPGRREAIFRQNHKYKKFWNVVKKNDLKLSESEKTNVEFDRRFLSNHMEKFCEVLESIDVKGLDDSSCPICILKVEVEEDKIHYCERFLELMIDLEAQLPTRRFFNTVMDDAHLVIKASLSALTQREDGKLFLQVCSHLQFTEQKLILKVGVASTITNLIMMNLRKQLASAETLYNKVCSHLQFTEQSPEQKLILKVGVASTITNLIMMNLRKQLASAETLYNKLLDMLKFYAGFEINEQTGEALTDTEMMIMHYDRITSLQKAAFSNFPELNRFALSNVANIDTRETLMKHFEPLSSEKLHEIGAHLNLLEKPDKENKTTHDEKILRELLISYHERRKSQLESLNAMPLYPTEDVIWDENIVPMEYFSGEGCLALPKLNIQFLTLHDYLLRNFNLFRLESTYEIRQDIEDSVSRMRPWKAEDGSTYFGGWARMAQPIVSFSVVEVAKPNIGENHPSRVRADVNINLNLRTMIRTEWENLRKHDVAFLITVRPPHPIGTRYKHNEHFIPQVGLTYVRGCEVEGMLDENGHLIEEGPEPKPNLPGDTRTFRVWLDPNQYQEDMTATMNGHEDVYDSFNIIMRRKPKENNFKAVLETIRDLMNTECVVPDWLHDIILGYGDPGAARYINMPNQILELDWNDTFLNLDHLKASFPDYKIQVKSDNDGVGIRPPFKLTFPPCKKSGQKRKLDESDNPVDDPDNTIIVEAHVIPNRGPYPYNQPKRNQVAFTPTQIEAVRAGMQPGLTMVVGPPGTGKTDVAVQIISNLYHNFPDQRTLIVTHSNQALNQLFEKIMALDIEERHLLRLGHGEEALETEKDFSRYGRVNYVLAQRLELLAEVGRLQDSLGVPGDVSYTCETAGHFFLYQVLSRWEEFLSKVKPQDGQEGNAEKVKELFPFNKFFENAPQPVFKGRNYDEDMDIAEGCFRHIRKIFQQLEEFRAFELLRSGTERSRYLLVKEARIIAMTCTHAALKRRDLAEVGFQYDNILMEESAQILEIETFIPLLLQNPEDGYNRLKRWIMIGDHHQLPPVIKNMAFQKFSNMEQSLFTRFVRLGVPTVDLDAQGRARPNICSLYNWRYKKLGDLPHVMMWPEYRVANPGFFFDYQLIDVQNFNGVGESEPNPFFYQNLAEAEYAVGLFMYMRLQGYAAEKITILTTYNGQKHLIRDVINQRCGNNPLIGRPHKVTTVDRYQGQQNDYVLLSLVRTKAVGHLRDVRRLVVAMSRARLGLYIFARVSLFQNCFELSAAFTQLTARPLKLYLAPQERYPTQRKQDESPQGPPLIMKDMPQMAKFVYDFYREKVHSIIAQHGIQGDNPNYWRVTITASSSKADCTTGRRKVTSSDIYEHKDYVAISIQIESGLNQLCDLTQSLVHLHKCDSLGFDPRGFQKPGDTKQFVEREQRRYDQTRTEEHPGVDSDSEDEAAGGELQNTETAPSKEEKSDDKETDMEKAESCQ
ncbi:hypothetical protein LSH36_17g07036 [Paralvinella palmiformis]|uniref:RNA helicase aquarius n=1 Tax=Paralvinella palmiformis TaxID=53620 RepID=A0AAD9NH46_9ANNE|nr:hypothetical protein LSH36_17g07036 [Paralvinella palmiformis]